MKRVFALLFVTMLAGQAWAYYFQSGDLCYNITSDSTVEVTQSDNYSSLTTVVIPEKVTYNGVEYSVTSIGYQAFRGCNGLTSVIIPNSVISIGYEVFNGCNNLDYTVYDNAYYIGNENNPYLVLVEAKNKSVTSCEVNSQCKLINSSSFSGCNSLTSVTIPNSVTYIGIVAFSGCSSLTSITIPNSVTCIEEGTFRECSSLTSVTIPESVTAIGSSAFSFCSNIASVTIPKSVTAIGSNAFSFCSNIASVTIPNSVIAIGYSAFGDCASLTSVSIPNSVISIGSSAFRGCSSLTSVTIPNSVTNIENGTFRYCNNLTSVIIPNSVTNIGDRAFSGCSSLTSVTLPNSVTSIGDRAFSDCNSLTSVTISNSITNIGENDFSGCENLKQIICLGTTPATLEADPFPYTDIIFVPANAVDSYKNTSIWKRKEILPFYVVATKGANETMGTVQGDSLLLNSLTITAVPNGGYHFVKWSDGNTDNPRYYSIAKDTSFTAIFEAHNIVVDAAVAATTTSTGLTEGSHC